MSDEDDDLFSFNPIPVRNSDPDTSAQATDAKTITKLEQMFLDALRGPNVALSTTEIARIYDMDRDSFSPRSPRLLEQGLIERAGKRPVLNSAGHLRQMIAFRLVRPQPVIGPHEDQSQSDAVADQHRHDPLPAKEIPDSD